MSSRPTSNISVGWLDLATFSELDNTFYDGPEVTALHSNEIRPVSHFVRLTVQLKKSGQATSANYQFAKTADFAGATWYDFTTPDITVKDDQQTTYRIAYTPNLGHNACRKLDFQANEVPLVRLDAVAMDNLTEANLPAGKYEGYMAAIGNVDKAVEFGAHLPPIKIRKLLHEMWFCPSGKPIPEQALTLCALKHNTMNFQAEFIQSFDEVIRVQQNTADVGDPAVWVNIDPKDVNLANIVDVVGGPGGLQFPQPDFWTEYVIVTAEERKQHRAEPKDILIEQVQSLTGPLKSAGTHRQQFFFSYPMRYLTFNERNVTASNKNNMSNYTTNADDSSAGIDPIRKVTLWYDNNPRYQNFDGSHFAQMEYMLHASGRTPATGHHLLAYCYDTTSSEIDGSTNFSKLTTDLEVEINETSTDSDDPETTACSYALEIRGVNLQQLRATNGTLGFPSFEQ